MPDIIGLGPASSNDESGRTLWSATNAV